jgi:hypothetical protein
MVATHNLGSTVDQILVRAGRLLNDYEEQGRQFVRWPKVSLLDYLNEALAQLAAHRRDAFAVQAVLPLVPGAQQELPSDYIELVKLDRNMTRGATGEPEPGAPIKEQDQRMVAAVRKPDCLGTVSSTGKNRPYCVRSYSRNPVSPTHFDVTPPVPPDEVVEVIATVIRRPRQFTIGDYAKHVGVAPEFEAALVDWVLYRAFMIDTESASAVKVAAAYAAAFYNVLDTQRRDRSGFNADRRANLQAPATPTIRYRPRSDSP